MSSDTLNQTGNQAGQGGAARIAAPVTAGSVVLVMFMATMVLPVSVEIATLRLTPIRILLLLSFIPLLARLFTDPKIKINGTDIFLMLFCLWLGVTILYHNGMDRLAYTGISVIELFGGYLVGRILIRSQRDFTVFMKAYLATMLFLFPFALVDMLTGRQILTDILNIVGEVVYRGDSSRPRWGLERVITGFEHPILFGLYNSLAVANSVYIWRGMKGLAASGFAVFMTFMSLSSGALLSAMIQFILIAWDKVTKGKWKLFTLLFAALYIFLEIASDRGPILIFIETLTFSPGNAWTRIFQWEYGTAEVMRHPIMGMGLTGDWIRPSWLVSSVDNYWLVLAMRHGLPGISFFALGVILLFRRTLKAHDLATPINTIRTGYLIGFLGMCFTLATVHIWGAVSVFVMFYIGAGAWIADASGSGTDAETAEDTAPALRGNAYTRFTPSHPPASQPQAAGPSRYSRPRISN